VDRWQHVSYFEPTSLKQPDLHASMAAVASLSPIAAVAAAAAAGPRRRHVRGTRVVRHAHDLEAAKDSDSKPSDSPSPTTTFAFTEPAAPSSSDSDSSAAPSSATAAAAAAASSSDPSSFLADVSTGSSVTPAEPLDYAKASVDVAKEAFSPTTAALKKRLLMVAAASGRGIDATDAQNAAAHSLIAELAAANPTPDPTGSDLFSGDWELIYSDTYLFRSSPFFW
jgi:hypothetical protein